MQDSRKNSVNPTSRRHSFLTEDSISALGVVSNRSPSFRSTGSRTGIYRHAFLKGGNIREDSSCQPIPPVLSQTTSTDKSTPDTAATNSHEGHSEACKVQPANTKIQSGRQAISKVRPAIQSVQGVQRGTSKACSINTNTLRGHFGISKVRPANLDAYEISRDISRANSADFGVARTGLAGSHTSSAPDTGFSEPAEKSPTRQYHESKVRPMLDELSFHVNHSNGFPTERPGTVDESRAATY